jgi:restriction endonuclease S subunit
VRVDETQYDSRLLSYVLRSKTVQWQIEQHLSGATNQIEIYPDQLAALKLPRIDREGQYRLRQELTLLESSIATMRAGLRQPVDTINEIVCNSVGFPLKEYQERERERLFTRPLSSFGDGLTLRSSVKFNHPDQKLTNDFFERVPYERVKSYLAIPIRLGVSLTPSVMDDDGEAFYVHPNALRNQGLIDTHNCHRITFEYFEMNKRRSGLCAGDVLLCRSGEGTIGKVALFDTDKPSIFSDFTMRMRFNTNLNPLFACYFFQSIIFQAQIEREKRGMGNMTNIFPSQVSELRVVAVDRQQQDTIAAEIKAELEALEIERQKVEERRKQIERLIEEAIELSTTVTA